MTSQTFPPDSTDQAAEIPVHVLARSWDRVERMLPFIASLKLTVVLFTMSIFLVFVGTLAQVNQDMWQVINNYFHSFGVWIKFQVFLPASWFPGLQNIPGGFPFPGGLTIGFLLLANLLAAHLIRFRIQATGNRMFFGLGTAVIGVLLTWLVIASGNSSDGFQSEPVLSYRTLWKLFVYGLVVCWIGSLAGLWKLYSSYHQRKLEFILLASGSGLLGIGSIWLVIQLEPAYLGDAGMRILWQLVQGGAAGLVMLVGCILLFRRRGGIVLIHSGIGLMMLGELLVGTFAVEQQISLREGETLNYALDTRSTEMAIVDPSSDEGDEVVVVPLWMKGRSSQFLVQKIIRDGSLPFDIEILDYYKNAELIDVDPQKDDQPQNPATAGFGKRLIAQEVRASSGADSDGTIDLAAAYVKLTEKGTGTRIGTYLLAQQMAMQDLAEEVRLDDKTYQLSLRFERDYKDYQLRLHDVVKEDYAGTDVPRHYASDLNILDAKRNIDQDVKVWMNNPVRYAGETFYQSGYRKIPAGPAGKEVEISTIQVVENTGWMIPYVSCMLVMIGLLAHFSGTLSRFLKRLTRGPAEPEKNPQDPAATILPANTRTGAPPLMHLLLPIIVVILCGGYVLKQASTPAGGEGQDAALYNFGTLPIVFEGRVKPYDTLARNSLKVLSGRESFNYGAVQARLDGSVSQIEEAPDGGHYITIQDERHYLPPGLERKVKQGDAVKAGHLLSGSESRPAISWLLDVISDPDSEKTRSHQVFKIDHPDLVMNLFNLKRRKGGRYSIGELEPRLEEFQKQVQQARKQPAEQLNSYQRKMIDLSTKIMIYVRIRDSHFRPPTDLSPDQAARMLLALTQFQQRDVPLTVPSEKTDDSWQSFSMAHARLYVHELADQLQAQSNSALAASLARSSVTDLELMRDFYRRQGMEPPSDEEITRVFLQMPADVKQTFATLKESETSQMRQALERAIDTITGPGGMETPPSPYVTALTTALDSYKKVGVPDPQAGDLAGFTESTDQCQALISKRPQEQFQTGKVGFESFFNHFSPFFYCWILYLVAFVLVALSWLTWTRTLNRTAFWLMVFTLVVHTFALVSRVYISGRPPVTNLYSSAVFIGWACVIFGLVQEWMSRSGIGNIVASAAGVGTLMIGHYLAGDGDTFKVLQAVLDTTFWLSTHVVCVTLGYATTFVAGGLGIIYILRGVLTSSQTAAAGRELSRMIYGITCFALFFSFVGTVLGGLWADDSWGRFWGWDPKENGALIIVIWNALILHARWGKMIGGRGLAILAVGGNIVTGWSWFGVNELGVGLHSYGFTEGVLLNLLLFIFSQLVIIGIGLVPPRNWRSNTGTDGDDPNASEAPQSP